MIKISKELRTHLRKRLSFANYEQEYESAKGIHTYHQCDCKRSMCRRSKCSLCWNEIIYKVSFLLGDINFESKIKKELENELETWKKNEAKKDV